MEAFSNNLKFYVIRSGQTQSQIAAQLGVSKGTFSDWISGRSQPRMNKVQQIAELFGIRKSDLLDDTPPELNTRPLLREVTELAATLNDDDLELVIQLMKRMGNK